MPPGVVRDPGVADSTLRPSHGAALVLNASSHHSQPQAALPPWLRFPRAVSGLQGTLSYLAQEAPESRDFGSGDPTEGGSSFSGWALGRRRSRPRALLTREVVTSPRQLHDRNAIPHTCSSTSEKSQTLNPIRAMQHQLTQAPREGVSQPQGQGAACTALTLSFSLT